MIYNIFYIDQVEQEEKAFDEWFKKQVEF